MRYHYLLLALLLPFASPAQKPGKDTLIRYFGPDLEPVRKSDAEYAGLLVRDPLGWNAIVYGKDRNVIMRGKYLDNKCTLKNGWFTYYHANGKPAVSGRYAANQRQDNWKNFYASGQTRDSLFFVNDMLEGPAVKFFGSGRLESEGVYKGGQPEGEWRWYHANGRMATLERYEQGQLNFLECYDSTGLTLGINCAIGRPPALKGLYGGIEKFLQDSVQFPQTETAFEGNVMVSFIVTEEGKMTDILIREATSPALGEEVTRVLALAPEFYPAVFHNRPIAYRYLLLVPFEKGVQGIPVQNISSEAIQQTP